MYVHVHVLTCGILDFGADGGDVDLTGVELVFSNCCDLGDDGRVGAVAELGGGGMVAAGLPNSITNLSLGCIHTNEQ